MLALLQRIIAISLALFVLTWAVICIASGRPALAPLGVLIVVGGYVGALAIEFVLLRRSFAPADPSRPTRPQFLAAWLKEAVSTPRIFLWRQPFRSRAEPDSIEVKESMGRRGVVLVHGYVCNRGIWNPWMRRLRAEGIPFVAVNMEPVFGSIDEYMLTLDRAARDVMAATGVAPIFVGHSMGGLAIRAWLAQTDAAQCHALVTIASPHRGTWMARHSTAKNGREMRVGSEWLVRLEAREAVLPRPPILCFWSHCDNIVFPSANATLAGADNRHLEATPHVQMIFHSAVIDEVLCLARSAPKLS